MKGPLRWASQVSWIPLLCKTVEDFSFFFNIKLHYFPVQFPAEKACEWETLKNGAHRPSFPQPSMHLQVSIICLFFSFLTILMKWGLTSSESPNILWVPGAPKLSQSLRSPLTAQSLYKSLLLGCPLEGKKARFYLLCHGSCLWSWFSFTWSFLQASSTLVLLIKQELSQYLQSNTLEGLVYPGHTETEVATKTISPLFSRVKNLQGPGCQRAPSFLARRDCVAALSLFTLKESNFTWSSSVSGFELSFLRILFIWIRLWS